MPASQLWLLALLGVVLVVGVVVTLAVLRHAPRSRAAELLGRGAFEAALQTGGEEPAERLAVATAARHLLELDVAARLLDRILGDDPDDGEALIERALVEAYAGRPAAAEPLLQRAAVARADLVESITLHRAWLALARGDGRRARRIFEEVEASLESKLRADLGGDPLFVEWFLHAALLWRAAGDEERAAWAWRQGLAAAPESRLAEALDAERSPAAASGVAHIHPGTKH